MVGGTLRMIRTYNVIQKKMYVAEFAAPVIYNHAKVHVILMIYLIVFIIQKMNSVKALRCIVEKFMMKIVV